MSSQSLNEYAKLLGRLRLVDSNDLQQCLDALPQSARNAEGLSAALQRQNLLTNFQVKKLEKGDTSGLVLGDAKLLYRSGSGTFARVYRAVSIDTGEMLGVKVLRQRWVTDPDAVAQFHREAELIKPLRHPNIVPIYDVSVDGEHHFFTMEFVIGGNLKDISKARGKISYLEATRMARDIAERFGASNAKTEVSEIGVLQTSLFGRAARDIAEGLRYALTKGTSHRDLKRTNVLLGTDGRGQLVDFGLAADEALTPGNQKKKKAQRSLDYATLEDGSGAPPNDPRSDLYFLGTIYFELLSGQHPYPRAKSREERQQFSRYWNAQPITNIDPHVPTFVVEIVEKLMHLNADFRYQSAEEALVDLKHALERLETDSSDTDQTDDAKKDDHETTLMFVEQRTDQQKLVREYFTSRGFRVLLVSDMQRALNRLRTAPPDCLVLMGGSVGQQIIEGFKTAAAQSQGRPPAIIAVLSKEQTGWKGRLDDSLSPTARVVTHPIILGDLRRAIEEAVSITTR